MGIIFPYSLLTDSKVAWVRNAKFQVDIDESETLDAVEMKKLVRKFQEKDKTYVVFL